MFSASRIYVSGSDSGVSVCLRRGYSNFVLYSIWPLQKSGSCSPQHCSMILSYKYIVRLSGFSSTLSTSSCLITLSTACIWAHFRCISPLLYPCRSERRQGCFRPIPGDLPPSPCLREKRSRRAAPEAPSTKHNGHREIAIRFSITRCTAPLPQYLEPVETESG